MLSIIMPILLTKSLYTQYLKCPTSMWLKKHAKEELPEPGEHDLFIMGQGNKFEEVVRKTYKDAIHIETYGEEAVEETKNAVESGATAIFQATVSADGYLVMADVLVRGKKDKWEIHEVKASTREDTTKGEKRAKKKHFPDVAFQKMVFVKAGFDIESVSLVYLNKDYVKLGEVDPEAIKEVFDVTELVEDIALETEEQAKKAKRILNLEERPEITECPCQVSPRSSSAQDRCPCPQYCYSDLPEFSVFDIPDLTSKRAIKLYNSGIHSLSQCESASFSDRQGVCIEVQKSGKPHIEKELLKSTLEELQYPLLFLDYETFSQAIPLFDDYKPWQHVVFQYSLHVLESPDAELQHYEFLWEDLSDPAPELAKALEQQAGYEGTVIVWNKTFECSKNKEMGELVSKYHDFFESLNSRIFDLMSVVHDHLYLHPDFKCRESIKNVLPALCPELSYDNLDVQGGTEALLLWNKMVHGEVDKEATREGLLRYCERDTLAMVKLYEVFWKSASF